MPQIVLVILIAVLASLPSGLYARHYLKQKGISVEEGGMLKTFIEAAPAPLAIGLFTLSFAIAGGLIFLYYEIF